MKRFLFLMLFFIIGCNSAFAVPGYYEKMQLIGGEPIVYDDSEAQKYFEKLEKEYWLRREKDGNITNQNWNKEVMIPLLDFEAELQRQGKPGFDELVRD